MLPVVVWNSMNTPLSRRGAFAAVALVFLLSTLGCSPRDPASGISGERRVVPAPIDEIDVLVRESFPPGYTARIISGLPSGCARFHEATITNREADTIIVRVTNTIPADETIACTAIYGYHETNLDLGTNFKSGVIYTVQVNDKSKTFTAQ